jgi:hypothetical protein
MTRARDLANLGDNTSKIEQQGMVKIVPSSVAVGSGTGSADATGKVTFSGASSVSLNDVFSATYDNYRIYIVSTAASNEHSMGFRLRVSGSDLSGSDYVYSEQVLGSNGTSYNQVSTSATSIIIGRNGSDGRGSFVIDIAQPFLAQRTTTNSLSAGPGSTTFFGGRGAGYVTNTTSYTGFTFFLNANMTGSVSVYGYN